MVRIPLAVMAAMFVAGVAWAGQDPAPAEAPSGDVAPDEAAALADMRTAGYDPLKVVCKRVGAPTGTRLQGPRIRHSLCMTRGEWEQLQEDSREILKERDRGICAPDCGR